MAVKNQAITVTFSVVDVSTGLGKTGDAANLTIKLVKDGVAAAPTNAPVEVDATNAPGTYKIALTAAEMNYDTVRIAGKSSTANVQVIPIDIRTLPIDSILFFSANASSQADYIVGMFDGAFYDVPAVLNSIGDVVAQVLRLSKNKVITDPITHTYKVYADDGVTVLLSGMLYEDPDGQIPYRAQGVSRREMLQ